jgi:7,8-dihydropterin-6-yl-methyl-4-(beta-D-ribofuranosyl)aminobenzene 5'-phosphate synthase
MQALMIYDNYSNNNNLTHGWGFSCLINEHTLFDAGEDGEKLLTNLEAMNVNLSEIRDIVISHDHWDHQGGLWALLEKRKGINVYSCPGFTMDFKEKVKLYNGNLIETKGLTEIFDGIYSTGEIIGTFDGEPISEQVLLCKNEDGLSIITGCAHPGIIPIVDKVIDLFPEQELVTLMGGFHLYKSSKTEAEEVYTKLKNYGFKNYAGTHCTGDFAKQFNTLEITAGSRIEL